MLPWESRLGTHSVLRLVRTLFFAWVHYLAYLRILRERNEHPIYQGARLAWALAVGTLLAPLAGAIPLLFAIPVIRWGLHAPMKCWAFWSAQASMLDVTWPHLLTPSLTYALLLLALVFVLHVLAYLFGRRLKFVVAISAVAPVLIALGMAQVVINDVTMSFAVRGWRPPDLLYYIIFWGPGVLGTIVTSLAAAATVRLGILGTIVAAILSAAVLWWLPVAVSPILLK